MPGLAPRSSRGSMPSSAATALEPSWLAFRPFDEDVLVFAPASATSLPVARHPSYRQHRRRCPERVPDPLARPTCGFVHPGTTKTAFDTGARALTHTVGPSRTPHRGAPSMRLETYSRREEDVAGSFSPASGAPFPSSSTFQLCPVFTSLLPQFATPRTSRLAFTSALSRARPAGEQSLGLDHHLCRPR